MLLEKLEIASKYCQTSFRKRVAKRAEACVGDNELDQTTIVNEAVRSLEKICEDFTGKLKRVDPPDLLQATLNQINKIVEDKKVRIPRWKTTCAEKIGARCKEILAELETQMDERKKMYAKVYNQRKHALQWLAKALGNRKTSLMDMEEMYTWGYMQIFNFNELAKAADDAEK